jgi:hypothetical protein
VLEEPPYFGWRVSRSLRRRRASPDVVEQGEEVRADLPTQDVASAMPKCKLELWWLKSEDCHVACSGLLLETLSPLSSLPVSASGRCLRASVPCRASTVFAVGGASAERAEHGSQVGDSRPRSGFSAVRRFRVSTVRSSRSRRALSSVIAGELRCVRDRETVGVRDSRECAVSSRSAWS